MKQRWSKHVTDSLRIFMKRGALFALAGICAVTLALSPLTTRPAHAQLGIGGLTSLGGSATNGLSSCAIETVGWVICPTMRSIARLADYGFTYINQAFLRIDFDIASNNGGTYNAWQLMRTIANALFVVAFMALIYSQLTGRNSGGYSIKRLLPRLIIAAVAVNVSYYICVIIIDISNILGDGIMAILTNIASRVGTSVMPLQQTASGFSDGTLTTITASVISKQGIAWVLLAPTAAVIVSIATVCAAMLVLLIMRKTVVAMLILLSPILFVAYLLPNLERFFFQGVRLFIQLLILYPIIALLLGAGQIVSSTIVSVGSNDANYRVNGDNYSSASGGSGSAVTDLTAAAAAVLPLLAVYFVFKNMTSLMSTAGARLSATVGSRRGGQDDKEARVTGKATVGAANRKNPTGLGSSPARRPSFSRQRRRSSMAGSALAAQQIRDDRRNNRGQDDQSALDAEARSQNANAGGVPDMQQDINQGDQNLDQNIQQAAQAAQNQGLGDAAANALLGAKGRDKDKDEKKGVTAKDIFNNMNQGHQHSSKDSQRTFGAGPAVTGGAQVVSGGGGGQPMGPAVSYRAPEIANQSANVVSGSSAGQPVQVIAVPVQVDTSSLLGHGGGSAGPIPGMGQPPVTGTEEKAKARAQKYIFDAEKDLDDDRDKQDILGHKDHEPITEQPHVPVGQAAGKDEEK